MERIEIGENSEMETKNNNSNDDMNGKLQDLNTKIDDLSKKMKKIENKIDKLLESNKINSELEVVVEEDNEQEEDFLTGSLMFDPEFSGENFSGENPAPKNTAMTLVRLTIATASEIAQFTGKDRAVESLYLNDLASRNKIRKLRIGRKIYFYTGRPKEIKPFKNSLIKAQWREILLSIIRATDSFENDQKIKLTKLIKYFKDFSQSENQTNEILSSNFEEELEGVVKQLILEMKEKTNFIKYDSEKDKVEFLVNEWLKLG